MLRAFLAKTVLGSAAPSSTPTVDVGRHRARMESARRAHHVVSVPHRETNLDPPTPTPPSQTCSEASMGRPASAVVSRGRRLPQGHAKGTPTWFTDLTPALSWTFSEPCRSDGYVWEVRVEESPTRLVARKARSAPYPRVSARGAFVVAFSFCLIDWWRPLRPATVSGRKLHTAASCRSPAPATSHTPCWCQSEGWPCRSS